MVKLASQFGLSDVGLRKICLKYDIPTPPLEYWVKLNVAKPVTKPALNPPGDGIGDRVFVSVFATPERPQEVAGAEARARQNLRDPISVPTELLPRVHPPRRRSWRTQGAKPMFIQPTASTLGPKAGCLRSSNLTN